MTINKNIFKEINDIKSFDVYINKNSRKYNWIGLKKYSFINNDIIDKGEKEKLNEKKNKDDESDDINDEDNKENHIGKNYGRNRFIKKRKLHKK